MNPRIKLNETQYKLIENALAFTLLLGIAASILTLSMFYVLVAAQLTLLAALLLKNGLVYVEKEEAAGI